MQATENRLVEVKKNSTTIAAFKYDGDGNRVQATENSITTLFIGGHYEVTNPGSGQTVTKYYMAGSTKIAMRKYTIPSASSLEYILSDHLGSTSITTSDMGTKISEMRYTPWGEVRSSSTTSTSLADYTFTGQYSYMDDLSTTGTEGFGLMFYNARMYDPYLARFAQADSIVPAGVQGYDRYAYVRNSPLNYTDPSGHTEAVTSDGAGTYRCDLDCWRQQKANEKGILEGLAQRLYEAKGSTGCDTDLLWNGTSWCHHTTYEKRPICFEWFECNSREQADYASRFQYPVQKPWDPIDPTIPSTNGFVVGGDFASDSTYFGKFLRQQGAVWVEPHGATTTNFTYPSHIFHQGQINRTLSGNYVTTEGYGTNTALWVAVANQYGGPIAFKATDFAMLAFSTADQSSGGRIVQILNSIP